jgi:hypothetical protein
VRVTGLVFVGTHTDARAPMARFVREVLGFAPAVRDRCRPVRAARRLNVRGR